MVQTSPPSSFRTCGSPHLSIPATTRSPRQPPMGFVSLWICLFWTVLVTGIIGCVVFCITWYFHLVWCVWHVYMLCVSLFVHFYYLIVLIHSLVNGCLGCCQFLCIMNKNCYISVILGWTGLKFLGPMVTMFNFLRTYQTVFQVGSCIVLQPPPRGMKVLSNIFTSSPTTCSFLYFWLQVSLVGVKWGLIVALIWIPLMDDVEHLITCLLAVCVFFFLKYQFIYFAYWFIFNCEFPMCFYKKNTCFWS